MKEIDELNLTENDFKMITDGLDCLPSREMPGEILFSLMSMSMLKDDPESRDKFKREQIAEERKKASAKALQLEEIRILQGKLFQLQRYLRMNGLLKQAHETLGS